MLKLKSEEFTEAMQILCSALPTPNQERRLSALWEFYQHTPIETIEKAARDAAHSLDRFPTPKVFGEILSKHKKLESGGRQEKAECGVCDGFGMVNIGIEVYAGKCEHGDPFQNFPKAPTDHNAVAAILRAQELNWDAFYGSGSWGEKTNSLREMAKKKCLPKGTWI